MKTLLTNLTTGLVCISCASKKEKKGIMDLKIESHVDSVSYDIGLDLAMRLDLQYKVINEGTGQKPKPKDQVRIHFVGKLIDGSTFDSSYTCGEPAIFPVNRVVPGFSIGLQLMSPGAKYQLYIPGHLGYGSGDGPGGPMAFMIFQVELLEIIPSPEQVN
ncbi:MAG: FKBP-type peptidyl-prolyl cis-trans isomerase [Candidatus Marinimicrobia bacterium]|nr:FKBP-type peptidyl-prolyl cis-trans isomerase [Candidatus Neomarinimicrobiota bacterium]